MIRSTFFLAAASALALFAADDAAASGGKSIVDPKYRAKDKPKDWVANLLDAEATKYKEVTKKTKVDGSDPVEYVESKEQRADGVDVDALFALAKANNLTGFEKFQAQRDHHGFAGRGRMTLANMLRSAAKNRHGLFNKGGTWLPAPADWLEAKEAPKEPTHTREGAKIVKPKVATEKAESDGAQSEAGTAEA